MDDITRTDVEQKLGHEFGDKTLLRSALTHSSTGGAASYERLEFLGDRVLGLVVAQMLFEKFPDEAEGDLAKRLAALVQGSFLAEIATKINLGAFVILSDGERDAGGAANENILADVFEALLGALYLDGGFEKCTQLIERLWADSIFEMKVPPQHPKTSVQEWAQSRGLSLPLYEIVAQTGPDHAPVFEVQLSVEGQKSVRAQGPSRQAAEKSAAQLFLDQLGNQA